MDFQTETELKIDLMPRRSDATVVKKIHCALRNHSMRHKVVNREFYYYDDGNDAVLKNGMTVRVVGGFPTDKPFRKDIKVGSIEDGTRKEASYRDNKLFTTDELAQLCTDLNFQLDIDVVAHVRTTHYKWNNEHCEVTFDCFYTKDGTLLFREIEVEAEQPGYDITAIAKLLRAYFEPSETKFIQSQKYARVRKAFAKAS